MLPHPALPAVAAQPWLTRKGCLAAAFLLLEQGGGSGTRQAKMSGMEHLWHAHSGFHPMRCATAGMGVAYFRHVLSHGQTFSTIVATKEEIPFGRYSTNIPPIIRPLLRPWRSSCISQSSPYVSGLAQTVVPVVRCDVSQ